MDGDLFKGPCGEAAGSDLHSPVAGVEALLRHPRYVEAAQWYVRLNLEACERDANVRNILGNSARHVAFSLVATLSARAEHVPGAPPATQTQVIAMLESMRLSSHGKIEALINRMVDQGMVTRAIDTGDRRVKALRPTETFLALDDVLCGIHARPCALLVEDPIVAAIAAADRRSLRQMRAAAMPLIEGGGEILARNPQMLHFLMSDGGWVVLFALMNATWRDDAPAQKFDAIAQRCGVSRTHVRNLVVKAHEYGLLDENTPGLFAPTADFHDVVYVWIAECLAAFVSCCRLARDVKPSAAD